MERSSNQTFTSHRNVDLEYEQINENFRFLADVRFKLLALVPALGGAAAFILAKIGLEAVSGQPSSTLTGQSDPILLVVLIVSVVGFFATLGITLYDQRNSELYNALIHRAKFLEESFESPSAPGGLRKLLKGGQFRERPNRNRRLIFKAGHDFALALIYGPLLGLWFFPISYSLLRLVPIANGLSNFAQYVAASIAVLAAVGFTATLVYLDQLDRRLYNDAASRDEMGISS